MILKWKKARAILIALVPYVVLVAMLEVRIAGGMSPWDVRLSFAVATMFGAWALGILAHLWPSPPRRESMEDVVRDLLERGATDIRLGKGMVVGGSIDSGDDETCGCGDKHEPLVVVPLPDGTCLVSHKDSEGCAWAARVPDRDAVGPAIAHHMEFNCERRKADT